MEKVRKYSAAILLILYATVFTSCNQSPLSSQHVDHIGLLGATIEIFQEPADKSKNTVSIKLFDKTGNSISNDSLIIFVNRTKAELIHKQGLYYTGASYYSLANVSVKDTYKAEIKLPDGKVYFLGTVAALQQQEGGKIEYNEHGDITKSTLIKWENLKDIDELSIYPSVRLKSSDSQITSYEYRPEIRGCTTNCVTDVKHLDTIFYGNTRQL